MHLDRATKARAQTDGGGGGADWMRLIDGTQPLSRLILPGTHESLALYGYPHSTCQALTLHEQLERGVRFLDFRFAYVPLSAASARSSPLQVAPREKRQGTVRRELVAYHGIQPEYVLAREAFAAVYAFLDAHPSESVVVSVKQEDASARFDDAVLGLIWSERPELWYTLDKWPTLDEVRGRAVLFCRFGFSSQRAPRRFKLSAVTCSSAETLTEQVVCILTFGPTTTLNRGASRSAASARSCRTGCASLSHQSDLPWSTEGCIR